MHLKAWNRRFERGDSDIPSQFYERPELDSIVHFYLTAWCELETERPIGMAQGFIPLSKIRDHGALDLGLMGEELETFIAIIRSADNKHMTKATLDPELTDQAAAGDSDGVKRILANQANNRPERPAKKPRVRHPRP